VNIRKVLILVEGQTEESFVKTLLSEFMPQGLYLLPVILATKRVNSGGKFKGGVPSYPKVRGEITRLLGDRSATAVTTMLDFYALPASFPGRAMPVGSTSEEKVRYVESAWHTDIDDARFRPYLSLHEFEALLFSDTNAIAQGFAKPQVATELASIRASFPTPEEINDDPKTAPSARLTALFPRYSKPFFGTMIARRIGLERMMTECAHFSTWVRLLQSL